MDLLLDDPDPVKRDLAYLLFLEEALGGEWVERWARERGKLDALGEWRKVGAEPRVGPRSIEGAPESHSRLISVVLSY